MSRKIIQRKIMLRKIMQTSKMVPSAQHQRLKLQRKKRKRKKSPRKTRQTKKSIMVIGRKIHNRNKPYLASALKSTKKESKNECIYILIVHTKFN
jgi:hypothetical protein